jgi:two-component system, chemotaxis family, protein-glutamate methylesterase/glutaminase
VEAETGPEVRPARRGGAPPRVVAIAASAGGLEALRRVVSALPADFPAAVCVVLHIPATSRSMLAPILDRDGPLRAVLAMDGAPLRGGCIYVAPADQHLLIRHDAIELSRGPKENGVRPAADPMFRSLAASWGECAVAVVLSGALDDGSAGAAAVSAAGGVVVVQDPDDALVPSMPASAIVADSPAHVVPADEVAGVLIGLLTGPVPNPGGEGAMLREPDPIVESGPVRPAGPATGFTCPECSGTLWELREGELVRYRCRVGHTYSEDAMVEAQGASVEAALWAALEVLEERGELMHRMAERMARAPRSQRRFRDAAHEALQRAALIRRALAIGAGVLHAGDDDERAAAAR